ncbi:MAG TPA: hypothetical protein ENN49_05500 [Bacteroidales bacterium]|nr:hypothetical protein [Bacteroidales bacterium]
MDAGDFIYILIAIGLAILNAVANNKKKQAAQQKRQAQNPVPVDEDSITMKTQELLGQEVIFESDDNSMDKVDVEENEEYVHHSKTEQENSVFAREIEYEKEPIDKPLAEEELYPLLDQTPLDVAKPIEYTPIDIAESKVEGPIGDYSYQESFNASMQAVDMTAPETEEFVHNKEEELIEPFLADFDAMKAIIYAEIIRPKYF